MKKYILAIDQGTTGSRAVIFNNRGAIVASAYQEFKQYFPQAGWVEHDAEEIWQSCVKVMKAALAKARLKATAIAAIGITNQRETTVLWDKKTSRPVGRAIVWQCRRTAGLCETLRKKKLEPVFRRKTGLLLDPYFSGTKVKWFLDYYKGLRQKAASGRICFGTIDSWLIWKFTGGKAHVTDLTNASRTLLFNIKTHVWDKELLKILNVPAAILPKVQHSGSVFGHTAKGAAGLIQGIPIAAVMGDQQSALYGQGCFNPGEVKNTYGTGCFIVLNTGKKLVYSKKGLLTTIACDRQGKPVYALEGSIFIAGAVVQWLRDGLRVIKTSAHSAKIISGLKDTGGVYVVPAFTGLGAPYWNSHARGLITGLTRGSNVVHIVRAALESIAYQTKDVFDIMRAASRRTTRVMKVDGGACQNNFLMQFQADILGCKIIRPKTIELTAQGAAYLAGVTVGLWKGKGNLKKFYHVDRVFCPKISSRKKKELYEGWQHAVKQAMV